MYLKYFFFNIDKLKKVLNYLYYNNCCNDKYLLKVLVS